MELSIIVVNWNTKDLFKNCLESIYKNYSRKDFEVIVVDNNSQDGSYEMVKEYFPEVNSLRNIENIGFAKGCNQAINISKGRYILILNPDIIIKERAIEKMLELLEKNNEAGAVGARLLNPDGSIQRFGYYRKFPTIMQIILFYTILYKVSVHFSGIVCRYWEDFNTEGLHEVDQIPGACILIKRQVVEEVGLLDEDYFIWYEDVDWCYRIKKAGWKLFFLPEAEVIHFGGRSFLNINSGERIILFHTSLMKYFKKYYSAQNYSLIRLIITLNFILINSIQILLYPFAIKKRKLWKDNISARFRWIKNVYKKEK